MKRSTKNHVTLRDVAAEAGVSLTTVSNFVNERFRSMSETTRRTVELAIEKLNYRPHGIARGLRLAEWKSIGIIIVDESPTFLADDITTHIVAGLSNFLSRRGFNLVVQGLRAEEIETSPLVSHLRTDGLCAMLSGQRRDRRALLDVLLRLNQPIILFQDTFLPRDADTCTVMQDDRGAGRMLAAHVVQRGARNLIFLLPKSRNWPGNDARLSGIAAYLRDSQRDARLRTVVCKNRDPAAIWSALQKDCQEHGPADAILCNTDEMALAVYKYLQDNGQRVPEDVQVAGYNTTGLWRSAIPTLTSVPSRGYEMGELAAELLLDRLRGGGFARRRVQLPLSLQMGESTKRNGPSQ